MPSSISSSENAYPAPKTDFFDPEHVDRPVPPLPWLAVTLAVLVATVLLTTGWEYYWRGKEFVANDFKNNSPLWAEQRRKATGDATVLIGSSRTLFDVDLDIFEEISGVRPVQLALEGTSPRIFLQDLADDEKFHGTLIVGVTVGLFFRQEGGLRDEVLAYTRNETLSERADHQLSIPLERVFAFIDEQTRPKRQMRLAPLPLREGMKPRFDPRKLSVSGTDRNTQMWSRVVNDEAYRKEAQGQWLIGLSNNAPPPGPNGAPPAGMPDEAINAIIGSVKANIDKIRARGGEVVFIQPPVDGPFAKAEQGGFPRERFWDPLLAATDSAGVTF
ncbi:MAG: hypothetical protein AAB227_04935, partial [Pseudomonadota bacterium]